MKADLKPMAGDWDSLRSASGLTGWLWVDTDTTVTPRGVHIVDALPESEPAQVTHVWGWGPGRWARVRVDREPGASQSTVRGALLVKSDAGTLDVVTELAQVWPASEGRVGMGAHPALHASPDAGVAASVHTVTMTGSEWSGTTVLQSLTFVELTGER